MTKKVGEPGYGVKEDEVVEPKPKKELRKSPDYKEWMHPDKFKKLSVKPKPSEFNELLPSSPDEQVPS